MTLAPHRLGPALALLPLFATGCLLSPDAAECSRAGSCESCTALAGCGWCPSRGCVAGSPSGPLWEGLYCEEDYRWDECTPRVDPCAMHTAADRCALASGCRWCEASGRCTLESIRCVAPSEWIRTGAAPSSQHPYANSTDRTWSLEVPPTAVAVRIVFSRIELEDCCDSLEVLDPSGGVLQRLSSSPAEQLVQVEGPASALRLRTDASVTRWGFEVLWVEYR